MKIDRKGLKAQAKQAIRAAAPVFWLVTLVYLLLTEGLSTVVGWLAPTFQPADLLWGGTVGWLSLFISILLTLYLRVMDFGYRLWALRVTRSQQAGYGTLLEGFGIAGRVIAMNLLILLFTFLWSMLFVIPGIVAAYRYRFALYNLYENPGIGVMEALDMSKRQTLGYKSQLFVLDLSYIGWSLLGSVPAMVYAGAVYWDTFQTVLAYAGGTPLLTETTVYLGLPDWAWTLVIGLWSLAAALFYLAHYQCVELGYFETAKRTSGVGEGAAPRQDSAWGGPDGLGGF